MIINHNMSAMRAQRFLKVNVLEGENNIRKLASGLRISRAGDDASGLAVSEKMRSQIRGLRQASRNAQDGLSLMRVAEGWLAETSSILQRMRELAVQSANGIYSYEDRIQVETEVRQLVDEVDRIASQAEFNSMKLLRGGFDYPAGQIASITQQNIPTPEERNKTAMPPLIPVVRGKTNPHPLVRNEGDDTGGLYLHIGANSYQREKVFIGDMSAAALGLSKGPVDNNGNRELALSYLTQDGANRTIDKIDAAFFLVNKQRANLGGYQSRLEMTVRVIDIAAENIQEAESFVRDLDMAEETVDFVKNQILNQTTASMLAQANLRAQSILRILG